MPCIGLGLPDLVQSAKLEFLPRSARSSCSQDRACITRESLVNHGCLDKCEYNRTDKYQIHTCTESKGYDMVVALDLCISSVGLRRQLWLLSEADKSARQYLLY